MTVPTTVNRNTYTSNGSATVYPYTFRVLDAKDLRVVSRSATAGVETVLSYPSAYSVSGVGNGAGGSITLVAPITAGDVLVIRRVRTLVQATSFRSQGSFFPASHEDALDAATMGLQQLQDQLDRSLRLNETLDPANYNLSLPSPTAGLAMVGTGTGFTMAQLDSGAVALPAGGRTTTTLSQYLANNAVINLADFLPAGTNITAGTADLTAAINTWYGAIPDGGYGLVPIGLFRFTTTLSFNRNVSIVGMGPGSAFKPDVGASADGIVVNNTVSANLYRIRLANFAVLNDQTNCCRNGLVLNRVHDSDDINVHVKVKATNAGTLFNGCLSNRRVLIITSANYSYPYPAAMPVTDSVRMVFDTVNTIACNANDLQVVIEGGANGLYIDDQHSFGNGTVRGVIEGQSSGSYTLYAKNVQGLRICDFHGESGAAWPVTLENCTEFFLGPDFELFGQSINLIGTCRHGRLDGVQTDSLTVASTCDRIEVGNLTYNVVAGLGVISDVGDKIVYTGTLVNGLNATTQATGGGAPSDAQSLFPNTSLERWPAGDTGVPGGYTFIANAPTYAKCGTGLGDTTRDYTRYCAKVTCATTGDAPAIALDWNAIAGEWVTLFARIRVPSGQPNVSIRAYFDAGATVRVGDSVTVKDAFTWISTSFLAGAAFSSALAALMPVTAGNFYVSHFGYAVGHRRPRRLWAHPSMVQTEFVLDGLGTTVGTVAPAAGAHRVGDYQRNSVPAVGAPVGWVCTVAGTPGTWVAVPFVQGTSLDNGDVNLVLTATSQPTQRFDTTLTANRTVTLPSNATSQNGQKFRIVRTAGGAFTLTVQDAIPATVKVIPSATAAFVDAEYSSALGWRLTGYGTL